MKARRVLAWVILLLALIMAVGHAPLALGISFLFRPPGSQPPPPSGQRTSGAFSFFSAIGVYFLLATILYVLGGILVVYGKLFRLANLGLIILAIIDNLLLIYTRTMPNIFFRRAISWSWGWFPLGTVQILIGQTIIILLCAILLYKPRLQKSQ